MSKWTLNTSDVAETPGGNGLMPEGDYKAVLKMVEMREWVDAETEKPKGDGVWFSFEWVITGPRYANKHMWQNVFPSTSVPKTDKDWQEKHEKARKRWFNVLNALGISERTVTEDDLKTNGEKTEVVSINGQKLPLGKEFTIKIGHSTNQASGETSEQVLWVVFEKDNRTTAQASTTESSAPKSPFGNTKSRRLG